MCGYPNRHLEMSCGGAWRSEVARLREERDKLRLALFHHRADLHEGSNRQCMTCQRSAEALGLMGGNERFRCPTTEESLAALKEVRP